MNLWVVSILFIVVYGRLVVGGEDETAKITKTNHSITTERKIQNKYSASNINKHFNVTQEQFFF